MMVGARRWERMKERSEQKKSDRQQYEEETEHMRHQPQVLAVPLLSYVDEVFPHTRTRYLHLPAYTLCVCVRVWK